MLHAVNFDRNYYTLSDAKLWLRDHDIIPIKNVHTTKRFYKFRINEPKKYGVYYSKYITDGILFVFNE
jgi:hypothetical protein